MRILLLILLGFVTKAVSQKSRSSQIGSGFSFVTTFLIYHVPNHWGACMALMRVVVVRIMTRIFCIRKLKTKKYIKY